MVWLSAAWRAETMDAMDLSLVALTVDYWVGVKVALWAAL
jgi:hypothetical protein